MFRRANGCRYLGLVAALAITTPAFAGAIPSSGAIPTTWTGNAEVDFPSTKDGVITLVNPKYPTINPEKYVLDNQMSTGWTIKDIRLEYDQPNDVMYVGVNFFGIAGDADSNGDPGTLDPKYIGRGAVDLPNLGGRESITVGFDTYRTGKASVLVGVPADKRQAGPGLLGFNVATNLRLNTGIGYSYGTTLTNNLGELMFNPSTAHPDFIFSVKNFSQLPGYDAENGFGLIAYAGTPDDSFEEEGVLFPRVAYGRIPEPTTVLGWSLVVVSGSGASRHDATQPLSKAEIRLIARHAS